MKKHQKQIFALAVTLLFTATVLLLTGLSEAGKPEKPDPVMDMLQDIYDIVLDTNSKVEGVLIQKTGQTTSYATGDDGDLQKGLEWPDPRFTDIGDGTVTDNLTGLIWLKNADCFNARTWNEALSDSNSLADEQCGLTDGSSEGDWRLANARELSSLIDFGQFDIALPAGHPFINVRSDSYWSSTTLTDTIQQAWRMCIHCGHLSLDNKTDHHYVWPVRSGN